MTFLIDVSFVADHDALKAKVPATTHTVSVQAASLTGAYLAACQMVAARGPLVLGCEIAV